MDDFAALLGKALGRPLGAAEPLAIAVSGGPDSVALLHLAVAAFPGRVTALTVDHGLRPAAATEAATLAHQCAIAGIAHVTLRWAGDKPKANLQASARAARYRLMADWCASTAVSVLATAHHADDQAETLLMRLARGSGTGGLAGIRAVRRLGQGITLVRPLLGVRRAALARVAAATGWEIADDPTNRNLRHDRTHARALLAATPWLDAQRLADAAANLADAEAALGWTADLAWAGRATASADTVSLDAAGLPGELVRRLVARAIGHLAPAATLRGPDLVRLIARLEQGEKATIGGIAAAGGRLWRFTRAPPRRETGAE